MDATLVVDVKIGNVAAWCRANGVNERTFYRHRARVRAEGQWRERSRRPRTSPSATPQVVVDAVLRLRSELAPDAGADMIGAELVEVADRDGWAGRGLRVPSRATINRILDRHGLLVKNPAKRPRSSYRSFGFARPRDCYQIDGTEHRLADGSTVVAIDVIDDCSRVWVASHVAAAETIDAALGAMRTAISEWGAPGLVLADNGSAFAHPHRSRDRTLTSVFSRALAGHGIRVVHSSPYHPQTCGKCERLHATAATLLSHRFPDPPADAAQLQIRLNTVRAHYNTRRRHSQLGYRTPARAWADAPAHGGPGDLPRQTDATVHTLTVVDNGTVTLGSHILSIGRAHTGATVTALRNGDHVTVYDPTGEPLGQLVINPDHRYQGALKPPTAA